MSTTTTPITIRTSLFADYNSDPTLGADLNDAVVNAEAAVAATAAALATATGLANSASTSMSGILAAGATQITAINSAASSGISTMDATITAASAAIASSVALAAGYASALDLPSMAGAGLSYMRVNSTATAYEYRTPTQVVADLGIASPTGYSSTPAMNGVGAAGSSAYWAHGDHVHPTDTACASLASPTFTGTVTLPAGSVGVTATPGDNTAKLATTAFVMANTGSYAPLASPTFTGTVTLPAGSVGVTATLGDNTTKLATTAFVLANGGGGGYAPLNSPAFTGVPTVPTAAGNTNTIQAASTQFVLGQAGAATPLMDGIAAVGSSLLYARQDHVHASDTTRAPLASPTFTGTVTLPSGSVGSTATVSDNTTKLATTAFVVGQAGTATPLMDGTAAVGSSLLYARQDHVHPTDTACAPLASPTFTGTVTLPAGSVGTTASPGDNTTKLATTAFVLANGSGSSTLPFNSIGGFTLSYNSTTVLSIAAGQAADSTNAAAIAGTAFTKSISGAWAAGAGSSGMGSGLTVAASSWYHVFAAIISGSFDVFFDTSLTAANKPAGTTYFRYIGSFKTDSSTHILNFTQYGQRFMWAVQPADLGGGSATARTAVTLSTPLGLVTFPILYVSMACTTVGAYGIVFQGTGSSTLIDLEIYGSTSALEWAAQMQTVTNTSSQVSYLVNALSTTLVITTLGYINPKVAPI